LYFTYLVQNEASGLLVNFTFLFELFMFYITNISLLLVFFWLAKS